MPSGVACVAAAAGSTRRGRCQATSQKFGSALGLSLRTTREDCPGIAPHCRSARHRPEQWKVGAAHLPAPRPLESAPFPVTLYDPPSSLIATVPLSLISTMVGLNVRPL